MSADYLKKTKFQEIFEKIIDPLDKKIKKHRDFNIISISYLIEEMKKTNLNDDGDINKSENLNDENNENTVSKIFEKEKFIENGQINDHLIFFLASKVCLYFPNGLCDLHKPEESKLNEINYNLLLITPPNFKNYFFPLLKKENFDAKQNLNFGDIYINNKNPYAINDKINFESLSKIRNNMFKKDTKSINLCERITKLRGYNFKKITWEKKFEKKILKYFEYIDIETKIFFKYIIKIHIYFMNEDLKNFFNKFNEIDKIDEDLFDNQFNLIAYNYTLLIILRSYSFLTNVNLSLDFFADNEIAVKIWSNEENYSKLARYSKYNLQLKPYALKYDMFEKICNPLNNKEEEFENLDFDSENTALLVNDNLEKNNNEDIIYKEKSQKKDRFIEKIKQTEDLFKKKLEKGLDQDYDIDNHLNFPPHVTYNQEHYSKFKTFDKFDNYVDNHFLEEMHPEHNNYAKNTDVSQEKDQIGNIIKNQDEESIFRSIDKLRLLSFSFDHFFKLRRLKSKKILNIEFFNRNKETKYYSGKKSELIHDSLCVFDDKTKFKFINHMRNLYGEEISFYFLWLQKLIITLIIPAFLGLIEHFIYFFPNLINLPLFNLFNIHVELKDIFKLIVCLSTAIWSFVFLKDWKSIEKLYSYFWGCEKSEEMEPYQESYVFDEEVKYIFDWKIKIQDRTMYFIRKLVSNIISFLIVFSVILINILILLFKHKKLEQNKNSELWKYIPTVVNAIIIKIMSFTYRIIAYKLSNWENHEKNSTRVESVSFKIFLFEFVNNFFPYFYIGFIKINKSFNDPCIENDCRKEIEIQSYLSLLVIASINIIEFGLSRKACKKSISELSEKKLEEKKRNHSEEERINIKLTNEEIIEIKNSNEYLINLQRIDSLVEDYIKIIIFLGYIMLISGSAPLTPFFILILLISEKSLDTYKIYNFLRVDCLNSTSGVSIYNFMFRIIIYIGSITNFSLVVFSSNNYLKQEYDSDQDFLDKISIVFILEIIVILLGKIIKFDDLPQWFHYLDMILKSYRVSYYKKSKHYLPHNNIEINDRKNDIIFTKSAIWSFYENKPIEELKTEVKKILKNRE